METASAADLGSDSASPSDQARGRCRFGRPSGAGEAVAILSDTRVGRMPTGSSRLDGEDAAASPIPLPE
jgi:hypothetical protein